MQTELEFNLTLIVSTGVSGLVVWSGLVIGMYRHGREKSFAEIGWWQSLIDNLPLSQLRTPEDFDENRYIKIRGDLSNRSDLKRATLKAS